MRIISQREARRLLKRVEELERDEDHRRSAYARDWPNGVHIGSVTMNDHGQVVAQAHMARKLKHAVVAIPSDDLKRLDLIALPLAKRP